MRIGEIRQFCKLQDEEQSLMRAAMNQLNLSARAYHRILKLARTIADLAGCEEIQSVQLAEALYASRSSQVEGGRSENNFCYCR
jgi:magnesium chelatase family protein